MITLAKRNLLVFFRDKASVFFSLLSVLIVIGLYVLFLGEVMMSGNENVPNYRFLMNSWVMAGVLAVTSVSATMGAYGIMVEDRSRNILKDFSASPISRVSLTGGYVIGAYVVGVLMSVIALAFAEVYIVIYGGNLLPVYSLVKVLGLILLSVFASSSMVLLLVSFFKSQNAFAAASTVIGTLIGFLTGIYVPIGSLPVPVQFVIKIFPVSHAGALFRQVMMEAPMETAFNGAPLSALSSFKAELGVVYSFGGQEMAWTGNILVLVATGVLFYALAVFNMSRKRK